MVMGHVMRPEQLDSQTAGLLGPQGPSETVPEEVLEPWAPLSLVVSASGDAGATSMIKLVMLLMPSYLQCTLYH